MTWPFFALGKSRRTAPIDFRSGGVTVRVEGTAAHGIATIWDADVLIWAASQWMQARDAGLPTSRRIRSEEHTSELQSLIRISYAVFCLQQKKNNPTTKND